MADLFLGVDSHTIVDAMTVVTVVTVMATMVVTGAMVLEVTEATEEIVGKDGTA